MLFFFFLNIREWAPSFVISPFICNDCIKSSYLGSVSLDMNCTFSLFRCTTTQMPGSLSYIAYEMIFGLSLSCRLWASRKDELNVWLFVCSNIFTSLNSIAVCCLLQIFILLHIWSLWRHVLTEIWEGMYTWWTCLTAWLRPTTSW